MRPLKNVWLLGLVCAGGCMMVKPAPREVSAIEREDGLSAMLTVDRQTLTWMLVVRNESDHPIGVYARSNSHSGAECGGAMVRFRDRERHFFYNDSEMPIALPGAWYTPASVSSRQVTLPVQMEQMQPGEQIVAKRTIEDLVRGLSPQVTRDPRKWVADQEFQIEVAVSYQDAYLRKQIEVRTDWIVPESGSPASKPGR